jgi:hypothetical protein
MITPASLPADLPAITHLFRACAASLPIDLGHEGWREPSSSFGRERAG